jgi:hypothetical protein
MTKLLLEIPEFLGSTEGKLGLESLLSLWERRCDYHPFIFYMGTDFCKLKVSRSLVRHTSCAGCRLEIWALEGLGIVAGRGLVRARKTV